MPKKSKPRKTVKKKTTRKKTTKKQSEPQNNTLYMGIRNPVAIRKLILENARDMVHMLQMYEKFKLIREEKNEAIKLLKKEVTQLNTLITRLKKHLPKTNIKIKKEPKQKKEQKETTQTKTEQIPLPNTPTKIPTPEPPKIELDDIDALEAELKEIEDKLNFL
jgi:methionyl-tRNA synthetase